MELRLPASIGGKRELILTSHQLEQILEDRIKDEVRKRYGAQTVGSKSGRRLVEDLLEANKLKDDTETLKQVLEVLGGYRKHAPFVRIAFAQEPDQDMYQKIVRWFRTEIHPGILVHVALEPAIGGGFKLQTQSKNYDFTFKRKIMNSAPKFVEVLHRKIKVEV